MAAELSWATLSSKTTEDTLPQSWQAGPFQRAWPETSWAGLVPPVCNPLKSQEIRALKKNSFSEVSSLNLFFFKIQKALWGLILLKAFNFVLEMVLVQFDYWPLKLSQALGTLKLTSSIFS